ncbi:MAG: N-acetylmuramic acid 6-phosphate etherase [Bryobacteraceae bacterium]
MLEHLLTEQRNPASQSIDTLPVESILAIVNAEDRKVADAVAGEIQWIAKAVEGIVERMREGGRLFYIGAGTSGRLGVLDATECPPTFHVPPDLVQGIIAGGESALARATEATEDDPALGARDLVERGFQAADALVGISASGRPDSELSRAVEIPIEPLTGPEVITGSTRMKAGTATKLVLNMLSTAAMIRLGHVYGNWMVNVQPTNSKLRDRAIRIVAEAAGIAPERAAGLLDEAGGTVKVAIVMARLGIGREQACERLRQAGGRISDALETKPPAKP